MTTIRVTRRPPGPRGGAERAAPESSIPLTANTRANGARLTLIDPPAARTTLDGAWWPRSRNLTHELAPLVEELRSRGIRVTRVAYNPDLWEPTQARRMEADGRTIRLGWFRSIDRQLLNLSGDLARGRLDLLVVPPGTTAATAQLAFSAASDRANREAPTALLDSLDAAPPRLPSPRLVAPNTTETSVWDSEGGFQAR